MSKKNIFLIGDSIRFGGLGDNPGYGVFVKEMLKDVANVYAPAENCRFVQYTLRYVDLWAEQLDIEPEKMDVVHWNNGLWDVIRLYGDEPLTPLDMYRSMLVRVYKRIRMVFPNARVIFALTTGVVEEMQSENAVRYNAEIEQYNQAAIDVLTPLGVEINDLYSVSRQLDNSLHIDHVHFNPEGAKALAEAVVKKMMG